MAGSTPIDKGHFIYDKSIYFERFEFFSKSGTHYEVPMLGTREFFFSLSLSERLKDPISQHAVQGSDQPNLVSLTSNTWI